MNVIYKTWTRHQDQVDRSTDLEDLINEHINEGYIEERMARVQRIAAALLFNSCMNKETAASELADLLEIDGIDFGYSE